MQMKAKSRQELYKAFIDFIAQDNQPERHTTNRKMLNVFFWCFILPALISTSILLFVKLHVLPRSARNHLDWLPLIVPVFYSLYFLSSEVLAQIPGAFRRGGIATNLSDSLKQGEWRERVTESLEQSIVATPEEWAWIVASFEMDLATMEYRTKYMTALAGAVFFLLMQGIDTLTGTDEKSTWIKTPVMGWVETTPNDFSQFVGLALFLILLYLAGSQTYQSLIRYLNCAKLVSQKISE
jgi:hypothetical protein